MKVKGIRLGGMTGKGLERMKVKGPDLGGGRDEKMDVMNCPCTHTDTKKGKSQRFFSYLDASSFKICEICNDKYLFHKHCADNYFYNTLKKGYTFKHHYFFDRKRTPFYCDKHNYEEFKCDCGKTQNIGDYVCYISRCNHIHWGGKGH